MASIRVREEEPGTNQGPISGIFLPEGFSTPFVSETGAVSVLSTLERARLQVSRSTDARKKAQLGQFLTPASTARFMASLFPAASGGCRLLDAGAGIGSLSVAFLERWRAGGLDFSRVDLDAFELDESLHETLTDAVSQYRCDDLKAVVTGGDFVIAATDWLSGDLFAESSPGYTHAILNPPYRKIHSDSEHRLALRRVGIETVNLYSAFVALAVASSSPGGQVVAIVPRSFCNGPYYRPFREFLFAHAALHHIHLFDSRDSAFRDDDVLQENVIIRLERGGAQGPVTVSTSTDDSFSDLATHQYPFSEIVNPGDAERFIHVPTGPGQLGAGLSASVSSSLAEIGLQVSTGPVVDFRMRDHLREDPVPGTVPLLYASHFSAGVMEWPLIGGKKPNAIEHNHVTARWLYPSGHYCVVRRFSSKEERRRIVASVVDPSALGDATMLAIENHLNVFHSNREGIQEPLAHGLAAFLNSTAVDTAFRRFNGHTQVNATDLRTMKYPSRRALIELGQWALKQEAPTQEQLDARVGALGA